jgi:hypothetical protein
MNQFSWRYSYLKNDSPYQRYGESPTPRISDTGSRYLKKKISLASIFRSGVTKVVWQSLTPGVVAKAGPEVAAQAAGAVGKSLVVIVKKKLSGKFEQKYLRKCDQLHSLFRSRFKIFTW